MKSLPMIAGVVLGLIVGVPLGMSRAPAAEEALSADKPKPAYLIAGWNELQPDRLKPFGEAVVPLARKAGLQGLAAAKAEVLEGQWPYSGIVIVQKYDSLQALRDFWNSPEHAEAKKLRAGLIESHFVLAVQGR